MKFTVSANKLEGIIFIFASIAGVVSLWILEPLTITDTDPSIARYICMIFIPIFIIWLESLSIRYVLKAFYNHIDIDGEMMTVYEKFTEPLTINCHDWDKIIYNYGNGSSLEFFYEKHYKKEKYRPVYTNASANFDKLLLYLKKNDVKLTRGW
jgi:hypothetical protein